MKGTEDILLREANITDAIETTAGDSDVSSVLAAYKSEGDPQIYEQAYLELRKFVEDALDIYKVIFSSNLILTICNIHFYKTA